MSGELAVRPTAARGVLGKYLTLLRLKISLAYFFPMALGFAVAADAHATIAWYQVLLGFLAFFCASFFASTLNFYADVEADRDYRGPFKDMDLKGQPFVTGEMGRTETVLAFVLSAAGCVAFSLAVSLRFAAFIVGFALVVGVLYSHPWFRLKGRPVTDILCNVAGMGLALYAGLALGASFSAPALFLAWGALFVTIMYIPTVVNDVPFDEAAGYRTSGVYFGAGRLLYAMVPLTAALIPLGVLMALSSGAPWLFRWLPAVGTPLTVAGLAVILWRWRPPVVDLDPNVVLVPMDVVIVALVVYGLVRLIQG